jgi:DNA repair ATPase RecN
VIDYLLVEGFQKVRRRRVKLDPGVTVFVGDSATGKSSTLRALKWLLLNVPQGDRYVGDWGKAKRTRVEAGVDGRKLVRKRQGRLNAYYLGGRQLKFDHVSKGKPPKPVQDLVNVEAANFQGQHDPPLWFTLSAPEVSRRLNNVVNLRTIDAALKSAASRVRQANAKVEVSRDRLREADAAREAAGWAAALATDLDRLSYLDTQRAELAARASTIDSAVTAVSRAALAHRNAAEAILGVKPLVELARTRVELRQRCRRVLELAEQVNTAEQLSIETPRLDHLFKQQAGRVRLAAKCRKIDTLLHAIDFGTLELSSLKDQRADLERRLKKMEGVRCPWCNRPIQSAFCVATCI